MDKKRIASELVRIAKSLQAMDTFGSVGEEMDHWKDILAKFNVVAQDVAKRAYSLEGQLISAGDYADDQQIEIANSVMEQFSLIEKRVKDMGGLLRKVM